MDHSKFGLGNGNSHPTLQEPGSKEPMNGNLLKSEFRNFLDVPGNEFSMLLRGGGGKPWTKQAEQVNLPYE